MDTDQKQVVLISQKDLNATRAGVPRKVLEEVKFFASNGFDVYAVAERIAAPIYEQAGAIAYKTIRWPISGLFRRKFYNWQFERVVKKLRPKLIIGHGDIVNQDIAYIHNCVHLAYELIHGKKIPVDHEVAQIHAKILGAQKFKKLVCNSKLMQKDLCQRFSIPIEKTAVVYPEYNPEKFNLNNRDENRNNLRGKFNIAAEDVVLGLITSGNFKKRNVSLLIDAVSELSSEGIKNLKIVIAGKDKKDPYVQKLKSYNLEDKFIFLPSINEVESYYHMIDIFVLPALIEEFGRSVLEAMGCALPVIVSSSVGASEILEGESKDFILHELAASNLTGKLETLIQSPGLRQRIGEINQTTASQYTSQKQAQKFSELVGEFV